MKQTFNRSVKQLLNLKQTSIHWNKMQLSETMKDVLKQLCTFEKQLAKYKGSFRNLFMQQKSMVLFRIQFQRLNGNLLKSKLQFVKF